MPDVRSHVPLSNVDKLLWHSTLQEKTRHVGYSCYNACLNLEVKFISPQANMLVVFVFSFVSLYRYYVCQCPHE
jgi:hypothetical protein